MSYFSVYRILWKLFSNKKCVISGEQEKEIIPRVRMEQKNPSLVITVCHHSADLVMPNGDPRDGLFYPTLTLVIYYHDVLPGEQFSRISGTFITDLF